MYKGPAVGSDVREDAIGEVQNLCDFLEDLGALWVSLRNSQVAIEDQGDILYMAMPLELVSMLDEVADVVVCEEDGCLHVPHGDWDFCLLHGNAKK